MPTSSESLLSELESEDLTLLSMRELRAHRERLQEVEYGYSYARRVVQGRLDTLLGELDRRGTAMEDVDIVEVLPETLSQKIKGPGLPRPTRELEPPDWADELLEELDSVVHPSDLARLHDLDVVELTDLAERVSGIESGLSESRTALHRRIDRLQGELISRYRHGASVDDLLT